MDDEYRWHQLSLQRIDLQKRIDSFDKDIATHQAEADSLQQQRRQLHSQLMDTEREAYTISRRYLDPFARVRSGSGFGVTQTPPVPVHSPSRGSTFEAPEDGTQAVLRRANAPVIRQRSVVASVHEQYDFAFAEQPPHWRKLASSGDEEPIKFGDRITSSNQVMLCDELKCIVKLETGWASIWCPICGANAPDDQRRAAYTYLYGMTGLSSHIRQSHPGACSGEYTKFVVDNGGTQPLTREDITNIRARLTRPEVRTGIKMKSASQQPQSEWNEMDLDHQPAREEEDRTEITGERSVLMQDVDDLQKSDTDNAVQVPEHTPVRQRHIIDRPFAPFTCRALAASNLFDNDDSSDEDEGGPISASQKRTRRRQIAISDDEVPSTLTERIKTSGRKSLRPVDYTLPAPGDHPWERDEDGSAS